VGQFTFVSYSREYFTIFIWQAIVRGQSVSTEGPFFSSANVQNYRCNFTQNISMAIRVFITGGTFDKEYNELTGQLYFNDTHMHDLLEMGRCKLPVEIRTLMMIDSLEMTDDDRELIVHQCNNCEEDRIVITHGTDTMAETARVIAEKVKNKTVILTGAMIPIKFGSSDGLFNLGSALAFAQTLPTGCYVAMNGRFFSADNVKKNKQTGMFEEIK
jgi:L-asparaginase